MIERNEKIFTGVRTRLKAVNKTGLLNMDLLEKANVVQNKIFATGYIETSFNIILIKDKWAYDFKGKEALVIKDIYPSWKNKKIVLVADNKWDQYRGKTGTYPVYATIFSRKLYLAPTPTRSDDTLEIWAFQTAVIVPMDEEVPPELDETLDDVIMFGICAEYDPIFMDQYQTLLNDQLSNIAMKKENLDAPDFIW